MAKDPFKYKPKTFSYDESRIPQITGGVSGAYDTAKTTYLDMLSAIKPRYEELYNQLEQEKQLAMSKESAMSAQESAQQKRNIAQRGLEVTEADPFYTGERGKLQSVQAGRAKETELGYASRRTELATAESQDTRDIQAGMANLEIAKAKDIQDIISQDKSFKLQEFMSNETNRQWKAQFDASNKQWSKSFKQQVKNDKKAEQQWKMTFEYTKSKDAADRALEWYKAKKSGSGGSGTKAAKEALDKDYRSMIGSFIDQNTGYADANKVKKAMDEYYEETGKKFDKDFIKGLIDPNDPMYKQIVGKKK